MPDRELATILHRATLATCEFSCSNRYPLTKASTELILTTSATCPRDLPYGSSMPSSTSTGPSSFSSACALLAGSTASEHFLAHQKDPARSNQSDVHLPGLSLSGCDPIRHRA